MATVNVNDIDGLATVAISSSINDLVVKPSIDGHSITNKTTSQQLGLAKLVDVPNITQSDWDYINNLVRQSMQQGDVLIKPLRLGSTSNGAIKDEQNQSVVLGFNSAGKKFFAGATSQPLNLRGSETRPKYNGNDIGLLSDLVGGGLKVFALNGYNANNCYDTGIYSIQRGDNLPDACEGYGTMLVMSYRKHNGNEKTDFATQLLIPPGNKVPDTCYFRTSNSDGWNAWQEISSGNGSTKSMTLNSTNIAYYFNDVDVGSGFKSTESSRIHFVLSPYFMAGTKIKFSPTDATNWTYDWAIETSASPEKYTTGDRRTNDSGWINATIGISGKTEVISSSSYFYGFKYAKDTRTITVPSDGYIAITFKSSGSTDLDFSNSSVKNAAKAYLMSCFTVTGKAKTVATIKGADNMLPKVGNPNIRSVNHRGYHENIPENTLSAFRESKNRGWKYVECDVCLTKDGIPVILHDATINKVARNADGSTISDIKYIYDLTYQQVSEYSFEQTFTAYRGERIPTLEQFVILCKNLGLHPYIEIKTNFPSGTTYTTNQLKSIAKIVVKNGMAGKVTWIAFEQSYLSTIATVDKKSRFGLLTHNDDTITEDIIRSAYDLTANGADVFIDAPYSKVTTDVVNYCINYGLPLEVWTVDALSTAGNLPSYVSGFTSNTINFDNAFQSSAGFFE